MIKSDYGHLYCPFYEQKFDNGLKLIFIPLKHQVKAAGIYIAQGGFNHDEQIDKSKIPFGTPYILERVISRDEVKESFLKKGCLLRSHTDFSFTSFSVYSKEDVFPHFAELLRLLVPTSFSEEDVEKAKNTIKRAPVSDLDYAASKTIDNLYYSSPIKMGIVPSQSDLVSIHYTALKKYLTKYYTPAQITFFIIGDYTPEKVIEEVKNLKLLGNTYPESKEKKYEENYSSCPETYVEEEKDCASSLLTLGFKFLPRAELYERYGQLLFYIYEVFISVYFTKNKKFLEGLEELSSSLVDVKFKQGSEDTYLLLQFRSDRALSLKTYLNTYLSKLNKNISRSDLKDINGDYYASSLGDILSPTKLFDNFITAFANNLPYTEVITQASKIPYKSFITFTTDFMTFPKSYFYLKKR